MLLHVATTASSAQALLVLGALFTLIFVIAAIVSDLQGTTPSEASRPSRRRSRHDHH